VELEHHRRHLGLLRRHIDELVGDVGGVSHVVVLDRFRDGVQEIVTGELHVLRQELLARRRSASAESCSDVRPTVTVT
jgi:hypothetical protein